MRREQVDIELEIDFAEIRQIGNAAVASRQVIEKLRRGADEAAATVGGHVDATVTPEIVTSHKTSPLVGGDLLLVAARFAVEVPDDAQITPR